MTRRREYVMFEDYADCFDEPSEAEQIIQKAADDLKNLLTEAAKNVVAQAAAAKEELESLQNKIRERKCRLSRIEKELAEAERRSETAEMHDIPRKYIKRFVREMVGDFAPGDTVWMIEDDEDDVEWAECHLCRNRKMIHICAGEVEYDVPCPNCNGSGKVCVRNKIVAEKRISSIRLKLCFGDGVRYWSKDCIYIEGREYPVPLKSLYKTREEAEAALSAQEKGAHNG